MLNYEACVILNAQLPEDQLSAIITKLEDLLKAGGAEIVKISRWGKRKLAHPIDKAAEGFYVIYYFTMPKSPTELLNNFIRVCRYDDNVLRQMIVNVPTVKRGRPIEQITPEPGWLGEFTMKLRPSFPRRRFDGPPGDRGGPRRFDRGGYGGDRGGYGGDRGPAPAPAAPAGDAPAESAPVATEPQA